MNNITQKFTKNIAYLVVAILVGTTAVYAAGTLTPTGTAGDDTHYSLKDIENKLTDFTATPTATSSPFTVPGSVSASFPTLTEIYDLLAAENSDLVAENVRDGIEVFGVTGNLVEGTPELEWSDEAPTALNWDDAATYCAGTVDGSTGWRLPTISELLVGIADDWIVDGTENRFAFNTNYWSGAEDSAINAWSAYWDEFVVNGSDSKASTYSVRCVR
jgi:hypothetical protein